MADLFKPLFNPNLLRGRFTHFSPSLTEDQREVVANWSRTAADPAFQAEKEKPFQGQFLTDVFGRLLGYVLPVGHLEAYNLKAESASTETKGGKTPDARLGFIGYTRDVTRGVIELKPPAADLDAKQPHHGHLTPVEQAFGYLAKFDDCRWVIVSNFVTLRLYSKRRGQGYAHEFRMADLADPETLRLFVFLLGRERLLAEPPGRSFLDALLEDSTDREEQLTRDFYALFSEVRLQLFHALRDANPPPGGSIPAEHEAFLLAMAQKILDRILFICFCEDTGLLPHGVIGQAFGAAGAGFVATTRWQQLRGLFEAVDRGHPPLRIHGYNGGLFRADPALDALAAPDDVLDGCLRLSGYDFATDVNVNILGHIFEQSITDLEAIRAEIAGRKPDKATGKRKREGVFYTPETITRYIVAETLGTWLRGRFEALQARYDPENVRGSARRQAARIALWRDYQEVLRNLRVLDPACGSGAFLVAAFDYLHAEYIRANDRLAALRGGQPELFDLDREILTRNLHGVDISPESVEITKLSLWLKTARPGKPLNDLDAHVRCGNSLVSPHPDLPPELAERAFDWRTAFPEVTAAGGFDCVIGNPPYIRQEWLSPCKATFQREFRCYAGTADAYLYFIERGLGLLRPGGMLGFITSGTFVNANFAAPFRAWLPTVARFHRVVNFGENQPFEDAEMVFPTISILVKETTPVPYRTYFMRGGIPDSIPEAVAAEGLDCDETVFARAEWRFQPRAVSELFDRLMAVGRPLGEAVGGRIYYGVKTGLNEAFLVNRATRDALVAADPDCAPIVRKVLRGEDLRPWYYRDEDRWLIVMPSGFTREAGAPVAEPEAWNWLMSRHPAIADHLAPFAGAAARRSDKGEFWWELRPCAYYPAFDEPKILWPDIAKLPRFSWDTERVYVNDKGFIIAMKPDGAWLVAMLQSRIQWFAISQMCVPLRLRAGLWQSQCKKQFVERLRIPDTDPDTRSRLAELALEATAAARERYALHEQVRRRIRADLGGGRPLNTALGEWWELDFFAFRRQLDKAFQARIPVAERDDWERTLAGWKADHAALTARLVTIEDEINDRVYALFGLSRADIALLEDHARHAMIAYSYGAP